MVRARLQVNTEIAARSPVLANSEDGTSLYGWVERRFPGFWEGSVSEEAMAIEQAAQIYRLARLFVAPLVELGESDEVRPLDLGDVGGWWEVATIVDHHDGAGLHHREAVARAVVERR